MTFFFLNGTEEELFFLYFHLCWNFCFSASIFQNLQNIEFLISDFILNCGAGEQKP
jgi:hypothetical protein